MCIRRTVGRRSWPVRLKGQKRDSTVLNQAGFSLLGQRCLSEPGLGGSRVKLHPLPCDVFDGEVALLFVLDFAYPGRGNLGVLPGGLIHEILDRLRLALSFRVARQPLARSGWIILRPTRKNISNGVVPSSAFGERTGPGCGSLRIRICPLADNRESSGILSLTRR